MKEVKKFEPMLAGTPKSDSDIRLPVLASPKLDGIRGVNKDGALLSRSLKKIPNRIIQAFMSMPELHGLDGEITVGPHNAPNVMQASTSVVMSNSKAAPFEFHIFDKWDSAQPFIDRLYSAEDQLTRIAERWVSLATALRLEGMPSWIIECPLRLVPHRLIESMDDLAKYESAQLAAGYEGVMVRDPQGKYKHGRSTVKEGGLLKLKRFTDGEAIIIGFEEEQENTNAKTVDEKGRSKRSSHAAGKVGKGTLGAFICRQFKVDTFGNKFLDGAEFNIGTGMDHATRAMIWASQKQYLNKIVKFKHFEHGVVDAPRHPVFLGFRDPRDMS